MHLASGFLGALQYAKFLAEVLFTDDDLLLGTT